MKQVKAHFLLLGGLSFAVLEWNNDCPLKVWPGNQESVMSPLKAGVQNRSLAQLLWGSLIPKVWLDIKPPSALYPR